MCTEIGGIEYCRTRHFPTMLYSILPGTEIEVAIVSESDISFDMRLPDGGRGEVEEQIQIRSHEAQDTIHVSAVQQKMISIYINVPLSTSPSNTMRKPSLPTVNHGGQ